MHDVKTIHALFEVLKHLECVVVVFFVLFFFFFKKI